MSDSPNNRSRVWIWPIVLVVCALMLSPAAALLGSHAGSPTSAASSAFSGVSPAAAALTPLGTPSSHASPGIASLASHASSSSASLASFPTSLSSLRSAESAPSGKADLSLSGPTAGVLPTPAFLAPVARSLADGQVPVSAAYLPSLSLLDNPVTSPSQVISPLYTVSPAPMGIGDFGLSSGGAYTVYTPDVLGALSLAGYNATAGSTYEATGAYYWDGLSPNANVTPWQSGIQLNTVVTNVSFPGSNVGQFWTQNVLDLSGNSLQLIDNVWNFSSPGAVLNSGTLYSYDGTLVPGEFYYAYGPTLPMAFPMTIDLYNNASNVGGRTTVTFGYHIVEGATVYSGVYDTVVFNSMPTGGMPLLTPDYLVNGFANNPAGLLDDAELIFGGPGGGSNAVINALDGTASLEYLEGVSWTPARAAYSYGTDTGETSIGASGTWSGATESLSQGPSLLYGLWNTSGGVPSGKDSLVFFQDPTYAFLFLGLSGTATTNLSYAPSAENGTVSMWLPPSLTYSLTWFADGFNEVNFSLLLSGNQRYAVSLGAAPGTWTSPIYMNGATQAAALALDALGTAATPYVFNNLTVNVNLTFNHLNDWGFPNFGLFLANGVNTTPIVVINVTQGQDSPSGNTYYVQDYPAPLTDLPGYGDELSIWSGVDDLFENFTLGGYSTGTGVEVGGAIALWNTSDAAAINITTYEDSFGVWLAQSPDFEMVNGFAVEGAVALTILNSPDTFGEEIGSILDGLGILDEGGTYGEFFDTYATFESAGFYGIDANYTTLIDSFFEDISTGVILDGCFSTFVADSEATAESIAVEAEFSTEVTVVDTLVYNNGLDTPGLEFYATSETNVSGVTATIDSWGVDFEYVYSGYATDLSAINDSIGVQVTYNLGFVNITNVSANNSLGAVVAFGEADLTIANVTATNGSEGALVIFTGDVFVENVSALGNSPVRSVTVGVQVTDSDFVEVDNVSASELAIGVNITASGLVEVIHSTATDEATGVYIDPSEDVFVDYASASSYESIAVRVNNSTDIYVENTNASDEAIGVLSASSTDVFVTGTNATDLSIGVAIVSGNDTWVNTTEANDFSIGVIEELSTQIHVDGVVASDPYVANPWYNLALGELPVAAVLTLETYQSTVENVTATEYPVAVYDIESRDLSVQTLNASFGDYGVLLNGTFGSTFSGIAAYQDAIGIQLNQGAADNLITGGSFVQNTGYAVDIENGTSNWVYLNDFINNNGATGTYDAAHIQAFSDSSSNVFNSSSEVGNYWADWHSYTDGVLNPYTVSSGAWDYHPIGAMAGMYAVTFYESGLPSGTSWSVTLNGSTQTTVGDWISFDEFPGTYDFTVTGITDYSIAPSSGAVVVSTGPVSQTIDFSAVYSVSFTESGLPAATSWSVWFNGVEQTGSTAALTFDVVAGTYAYSVVNPSGYAATPSSGSITLSANYTVPVAFASTLAPIYSVTVVENGLVSGTTWSAIFNGVEESTSTGSLTFTVPAGTYAYQILNVPGYTATPSSGMATVSAGYLIGVSFASTTGPTYTVWVNETGLPSLTSWSAIVNGVEETTTGTSLAFTVPAGTYSYQVLGVSGYSATPSSGSATVGANYLIAVSYSSVTGSSSTTYTVWINETGLPGETSWSAIFDGVEETTSGTSLSFTVTAGTYSYQVLGVSGYSVSPSSGSATVGGNYAIAATYSSTAPPSPATYTVTVNETGLPSGTTWSAVFDGVEKSTAGTSITFTVAAGTYSYEVSLPSGYAATPSSGTATVGGNYLVLVSYSSSSSSGASTPSYVSQSSYNTGFEIALIIAVVALLIALVALLRRPKVAAPPPAAQWQEPAGPGEETPPSGSH